MTKEIKLTQGKIALVDDEDYAWLSQRKWQYRQNGRKDTGYAGRIEHGKVVWMHRLILNASEKVLTDHIDRNKLNNQRYNLRSCTNTENQHNGKVPKHNTSGFKGVGYKASAHKYRARARLDKKDIHLGYFDNPMDAALAYDKFAKENYGEFAAPNFL